MEMYFNPYPGAVKSIEEGSALAVKVADAFYRLKKELRCARLSGRFAVSDTPPSRFILVRRAQGDQYGIRDILFMVSPHDREKLKLLLNEFSMGRIIASDDMDDIENWVVANIGAPAPILELAAKSGAIALTIPTEPEWRVDVIEFKGKDKPLYNLWGQEDISRLKDYCIDALANTLDRFSARYRAKFCDGALNSAPDFRLWQSLGFFRNMAKAHEHGYEVDSDLIKNVGSTKYGTLRELRCLGTGWRIFFVLIKDINHEILIGGFYSKNGGIGQEQAIEDAKGRVDSYENILGVK
jgi:hypothetical protein